MTLTVRDRVPDGATGQGHDEVPLPGASVTGSAGRSQRRPARWPDGGLGALLGGALALMAARPLVDNSFLTHLATGRILLSEGVPSSNPFLYSSTAFPIPSWWWSAVLGAVDAVSGGAGLRLLTAALAGVLGVLVVRLTRTDVAEDGCDDRRLLSVVLPAACAFITLLPFLNGRPQLPGYLLLAATVLVVKERKAPWWLLPVFLAWVNVHGTWMYGLAVLAVLLGAEAVDRRRVEARQLLCGVAATVGVLLGGLVGPGPFRLVELPFEQFGDDRARRAIAAYQEWQPAGFGNPLTWLLMAMGLVAVVGAVRRRRWGTLAGSVAMVALGLSAGRLLPLAAITLVPWTAVGLQGLGGLGLPRGRVRSLLGCVGVALVVLAAGWAVATPAYDLSKYPVAAVDWMRQRGLAGRGDVKILSHDYVGNYLDWRFGERASTFVDDRPGVDAALDYATLIEMRSGWRAALHRADPDVIVWSADARLGRHLPASEWFRAGELDGFNVFCRSSIADRCR